MIATVLPELRRIHGIGHLGTAARHYPYLTLAVLVVVVAWAIYASRHR